MGRTAVYTGKPSLYLNDISAERLRVPEGSRITIRLYGEVGKLTVAETVSGRTTDVDSAAEPTQSFEVKTGGTLSINGEGGRKWSVIVEPDNPPAVQLSGVMERGVNGELRQPFFARDDYAVVGGTARITLDSDAVDRRYGRIVAPEPRETIVLDLPLSITGDRAGFEETLIENLSKHPWSGLAVNVQLTVEDDLGQTGDSAVLDTILPGRRFFEPLANAIVEQRRDLLWSRENGARVAGLLRAISHRPDGFVENNTAYLKLRITLKRLELRIQFDQFDAASRDEIAEALWDVALSFEEGRLTDALERLRRAQDRLAEAMRQGASDEEIAELMQELREAMQEYMNQLAQENQEGNPNQQFSQNQDTQEITGDQLNEMLERLQELMEQGRMAEAQELLDQLRQMMENMQVTQGQQGQGQQSPGEQAMQGLQETLRNQQGLSDEAFRDLQEQFNPDAQAGQSGQNEGRSGGQGSGAQHDGQGTGEGQGQAENGGTGNEGGESGLSEESLANRQQALRNELQRQTQNLPGRERPKAMQRARPWTGLAERWTAPKRPFAAMICPRRSTIRPTRWKPCAKACAILARPWRRTSKIRTSSATRGLPRGRTARMPAILWGARPVRKAVWEPTRICFKGRMSIVAQKSCWTKSAAARASSSAPSLNATISSGFSTGSEAQTHSSLLKPSIISVIRAVALLAERSTAARASSTTAP